MQSVAGAHLLPEKFGRSDGPTIYCPTKQLPHILRVNDLILAERFRGRLWRDGGDALFVV
jgi:hypothetical protein